MHASLPANLRQWVADRAERMGLPESDSYLLLPIRPEKQRQEVVAHLSQ